MTKYAKRVSPFKLSRSETSSSRFFAPLALGEGASASRVRRDRHARLPARPRPSRHAWRERSALCPSLKGPRLVRDRYRDGPGPRPGGHLPGLPMDGRGVQARGRRPASLPAAIGGQVSMYRSGSDGRPWNCLLGRHPGDMETYGRYYGTSIRTAAWSDPTDQPLACRPGFGRRTGEWKGTGFAVDIYRISDRTSGRRPDGLSSPNGWPIMRDRGRQRAVWSGQMARTAVDSGGSIA